MTNTASAKRINLDFDAIGTAWHIEFVAPAKHGATTARMLTERIQEFDATYSRFRPDSWVQMVGNNPGTHKAPEDFAPMFDLYKKL